MPTYAILGATGATGGSILKYLLETAEPDLSIRLYVRSSKKLHQLRPNLDQHPNITVFEGPMASSAALADCIRGATAIFSTIASNSSSPGLSIATDSASAIVTALASLKAQQGPAYQPPTIVMLSAVTINPVLSKGMPAVPHAIITTALSYLYSDLLRAEAFYREQRDAGLLDVVFAQPPGLMPGEKRTGYRLSTEEGGSVLSYGDLGASMVEMAERRAEFSGLGVGVVSTGKVDVNWGPNVWQLLGGLVAHFAPGFYCWWWGMGKGRLL